MYLIITRDRLLFAAIAAMTEPAITVHIQRTNDICPRQHGHACVIIDMFRNNILHTPMAEMVKQIKPKCIYILSPFGIKKCFPGISVRFMPRQISVSDFEGTVLRGIMSLPEPILFFTRRQHQAASLLLQWKNTQCIINEMNILPKTLLTHQYHIMLLLNLRRFSGLITHRFAVYLCNEHTELSI